MTDSYSAVADWLNKFQAASETIQALWIITILIVVLGSVATIARAAVDIARSRRDVRYTSSCLPAVHGAIRLEQPPALPARGVDGRDRPGHEEGR